MAASGHLEWCQTIVGRLIRIQFSPGSFRRKFTALDLDLLMAVIASLSRTGGASHRRGHHPHGPGRLGDEKQPLNGTGPSQRKPGRAFTYHHAALGQSETYPSAPANP